MVNKGIFLDGDNGGTFLHFGSYQNSCISDPTFCGPEGECTVAYMPMIVFQSFQFHLKKDVSRLPGITFSFFWKNYEDESRFAVASGGKVISNGFSVYTNPFGGYVEFYTRGNNHRWKANIKVPGNFVRHNSALTNIYIKIECILVMNLNVFWCKVIEMLMSEMVVTSHLITIICSVTVEAVFNPAFDKEVSSR